MVGLVVITKVVVLVCVRTCTVKCGQSSGLTIRNIIRKGCWFGLQQFRNGSWEESELIAGKRVLSDSEEAAEVDWKIPFVC